MNKSKGKVLVSLFALLLGLNCDTGAMKKRQGNKTVKDKYFTSMNCKSKNVTSKKTKKSVSSIDEQKKTNANFKLEQKNIISSNLEESSESEDEESGAFESEDEELEEQEELKEDEKVEDLQVEEKKLKKDISEWIGYTLTFLKNQNVEKIIEDIECGDELEVDDAYDLTWKKYFKNVIVSFDDSKNQISIKFFDGIGAFESAEFVLYENIQNGPDWLCKVLSVTKK